METLEREICEAEARLLLADESPEPDTSAIISALLDEQVILLGPAGRQMSKAYIVDAHRPPKKQPFESVKMTDIKVQDLGEDAAVVTGQCEYTLSSGSFSMMFLRVWRKRDSQWKVIAGTVTMIQDHLS